MLFTIKYWASLKLALILLTIVDTFQTNDNKDAERLVSPLKLVFIPVLYNIVKLEYGIKLPQACKKGIPIRGMVL